MPPDELIPSDRGELSRKSDGENPIVSQMARDLLARGKEKAKLSESKEKGELAEAKADSHVPATLGPMVGNPWTIPDLSLEMLWCNPGTFEMGSPKDEEGRPEDAEHGYFDETLHTVTLTQGFWLGKYPVTQAQWKHMMGDYPSCYQGVDRPVEQVSWDDVTAFCEKLTERERKAGRLPEGMAYQLPTEAQWEYTCRAGTTTVFAFGDSLSSNQANIDGRKPYGGAVEGALLGRTTDVGSYQPNPWGFFDMHGNVWEWCADRFIRYPNGEVRDPVGPSSAHITNRVLRGGCCDYEVEEARSARRIGIPSSITHYRFGFRLSLRQQPARQIETQAATGVNSLIHSGFREHPKSQGPNKGHF